jgi:hypothetical protein
MKTVIFRVILPCALIGLSLPAPAQNVRFITQGSAYAFAEDQLMTERVIDHVVGAPVGEGTQIIFFRPVDTRPGKANLSEGNTSLAELPSGAYYATTVTPGVHTYFVDGSALQLQCDPGKRRYVRVSHRDSNPKLQSSEPLTFLRTMLGKRPPLLY